MRRGFPDPLSYVYDRTVFVEGEVRDAFFERGTVFQCELEPELWRSVSRDSFHERVGVARVYAVGIAIRHEIDEGGLTVPLPPVMATRLVFIGRSECLKLSSASTLESLISTRSMQ